FEGSTTIPTAISTASHGAFGTYLGLYDSVGRFGQLGTSQIQLNPNRRAVNFTVSSNPICVNTIIVPVEANSNGIQSANDFDCAIYTDDGGEPDSVVATATYTSVELVDNEYCLVISLQANASLAANTTYWLVLEWDRPNDPGNNANLYLEVSNAGTGLTWN